MLPSEFVSEIVLFFGQQDAAYQTSPYPSALPSPRPNPCCSLPVSLDPFPFTVGWSDLQLTLCNVHVQ